MGRGGVARVVAAVAGVVVVAGASLAAGWFARGSEFRSLNQEVSRLRKEVARLESSLTASIASATPVAPAETTGGGAAEAEPTRTPVAEAAEKDIVVPKTFNADRQFSAIVGVQRFRGEYRVVADFMQFLTGDAAARAAAAAGEESPPPNDYFIVNENPRLRVIPVRDASVRVKMYSRHEGVDTDGYYLTFERWYQIFTGDETVGPITRRDMTAAGFWLTIRNGKLVAMEEQWVP